MRGFSGLFRTCNQVISVLQANRPSVFYGLITGNLWRHDSMHRTLDSLNNVAAVKSLTDTAMTNLARWESAAKPSVAKVEVIKSDWGVATQEIIRQTGKIYAVLNMASARFPGGGALEGGSAQEENMCQRTNLLLQMLTSSDTFLRNNTFYYQQEMQALINAEVNMDEAELALLNQLINQSKTAANKVYLNPDITVGFRGPELLVPNEAGDLVADSELSFPFLNKHEIFPFRELRSAAPQLAYKGQFEDSPTAQKSYVQNVRLRIAAQLDTLILVGISRAVLGAWGCGSFNNNPVIIADLYQEEILKRAAHFEHIVFPVLDTSSRFSNFAVFHSQLDGLPLEPELKQVVTKDAEQPENPDYDRGPINRM